MKIRIRGNALRIRLSKSEVDRFAGTGSIEESTDFGNSTLQYAVKSTEQVTMSAEFSNNKITLLIPESMLQNWAATNLVGLEYKMPLNNNNHLQLLLEKDFKCIDAVISEDQSDYFENPVKAC